MTYYYIIKHSEFYDDFENTKRPRIPCIYKHKEDAQIAFNNMVAEIISHPQTKNYHYNKEKNFIQYEFEADFHTVNWIWMDKTELYEPKYDPKYEIKSD